MLHLHSVKVGNIAFFGLSANLLSSQVLIFRLSENLVTSRNQLNKINISHSVPCHQPVLFPKSEYWNYVNEKCLAVGLCRPPMGQSVDICLVNCPKDVYEENRKWMKSFAAGLKMNPECKALWKNMLVWGSSMAADFWAFTCPSPDIHRTHQWTSVPGKTLVWIVSAHVSEVCNVTVMWVSLKCTKWNMSACRVSWECPAGAGCRPESHFYRKFWGKTDFYSFHFQTLLKLKI
mgnify:FL=1